MAVSNKKISDASVEAASNMSTEISDNTSDANNEISIARKSRVQKMNLDELAKKLAEEEADLEATLSNLKDASRVDRETMNLQIQL